MKRIYLGLAILTAFFIFSAFSFSMMGHNNSSLGEAAACAAALVKNTSVCPVMDNIVSYAGFHLETVKSILLAVFTVFVFLIFSGPFLSVGPEVKPKLRLAKEGFVLTNKFLFRKNILSWFNLHKNSPPQII